MDVEQQQLQKSILATVAYYDGLKYPLSAFEIWKYIIRADYSSNEGQIAQPSLSEVIFCLQQESISRNIENQDGFYFLRGRKDLVAKRIESGKISAVKIKQLRRIVKWIIYVPFVRMVGVTGRLAMKNAQQGSDWDLLVVIKDGHIWTGRTLVTAAAHILGKRRHGKKVADRVCLNFFVTDESLEVITKDLFSASEYMFLLPLWGWETYQRFQVNNAWIKDMRPSYMPSELAPIKEIVDSGFAKKCRAVGEEILASRSLEKWLKKIEKKRIMKNPKTHQEGSLVYADDDALIFLPNPHGPRVFEEFKEKMEKISI
ncbi:MAG TPA: hypothetical protein VF817_05145 [Patescibacteria group bacterium]